MARHRRGDRTTRTRACSASITASPTRRSIFARYNFDQRRHRQPGRHRLHDQLAPSQQLQRAAPAHFRVRRSSTRLKFGYNASLRHSVRDGPQHGDRSRVSGFTALTGPQEITEDGRTFSVLNDIGILRGRHNIKMGGEIRRIFVDVGEGNTTSLTYCQPAELPDQPCSRASASSISPSCRDSAGGCSATCRTTSSGGRT